MQKDSKGEIIMYRTKGGKTALEVNLREETIWLFYVQMK